VGDTIPGEALDPEGDVDTFTFAVTAGDTLTVSVDLQYPAFDLGDGDAVDLVIFEPGTGAVVAQALGAGSTGYLWDLKTAPFVAPATGTLSLRIQGQTGSHSLGPYRFLVGKQ
jgi:hypothetical protein